MVASAIKGGLESILSKAGDYMPSRKDVAQELAAEVIVEYVFYAAGTYLSGIKSRLEEASNFYERECKGDIKPHHLDELSSIMVYGDSTAYRNYNSGMKKRIHSYLSNTLKIAKVDKLDNWKYTKGLFQKALGYAPQAVEAAGRAAEGKAVEVAGKAASRTRGRRTGGIVPT